MTGAPVQSGWRRQRCDGGIGTGLRGFRRHAGGCALSLSAWVPVTEGSTAPRSIAPTAQHPSSDVHIIVERDSTPLINHKVVPDLAYQRQSGA